MVSKEVFNNILKEYEATRNAALKALENRRNEIYKAIPRIKEVDDSINKLSIEVAKSILKDAQTAQRLASELEQKSMDLKIEKSELLATHNYPTDYLTIKYKCKSCKDTGFTGSEKCSCLKQKLINYAYKQSNLSNILDNENFENFNFEYYSDALDSEKGVSPKQNMQIVYKTCLDFVTHFDTKFENLLFTGSTGLGKTFLSNCIAKDILDKSKTVFYQTAFKIFNLLEDYKFSKDKDSLSKDKLNILFDVDLLIIDDLGSEFVNSYTSSEFFNILNTRLLDQKKTIISTNLSLNELFNLYTARAASRIYGHYKVLEFFGEDIRIKKKLA